MPKPTVKFIDSLPPAARGREANIARQQILETLRRNPSTWAEVLRRPAEQAPRVRVEAARLKKDQIDIETATRKIGTEVILYARAIKTPNEPDVEDRSLR